MVVEALSPSEAKAKQGTGEHTPDCVMRAANELLVKNLRHGRSSFTLDALIALAGKYAGTENRTHSAWKSKMFSQNAFDIEPVFRAKGWNVRFDKPGYCESYAAFFEFSERREVEGSWWG